MKFEIKFPDLAEANEFATRLKNENLRGVKVLQAETTETLISIWNDMRENAFLNYLVNRKTFDQSIEEFKQLELEAQKRMLFDILDKNQLYLNYGVSDANKKLNNQFYKIR